MHVLAMIGLVVSWAGLLFFGGWLAFKEKNDLDRSCHPHVATSDCHSSIS
jgi:hypothetical protein